MGRRHEAEPLNKVMPLKTSIEVYKYSAEWYTMVAAGQMRHHRHEGRWSEWSASSREWRARHFGAKLYSKIYSKSSDWNSEITDPWNFQMFWKFDSKLTEFLKFCQFSVRFSKFLFKKVIALAAILKKSLLLGLKFLKGGRYGWNSLKSLLLGLKFLEKVVAMAETPKKAYCCGRVLGREEDPTTLLDLVS